jgi:tetratricopeptide (TPR) repeat protein
MTEKTTEDASFQRGTARAWRPAFSPWLVLALLGLVLLLHAYSFRAATADDAFIAYRYAENFSRGAGLVFNEGERVEGYTDFLWVVMLAGLHSLGADTVTASQVLGALFAVLLLPLLYLAARHCCGMTKWTALAPCAVLTASAAFSRWTVSGLETVPYGVLFTLALAFSLVELRKDPRLPLSGLLWGLAALMRPEAIGLFMALCAFAVFPARCRFRTGLCIGIGFALLVVPHFIFRLCYYGYLLPNTFYAKVSPGPEVFRKGFLYVVGFLARHGPWALLALPGLLSCGDRARGRLLFLSSSVLLVAFLYVASVGDDFYAFWRFCTPYLPWLVLLVCAGAWHGGVRLQAARPAVRPRLGFLCLAAVAGSMAVSAKLWPELLHPDFRAESASSNRILELYGRWFRENRPPSTVIAVTWLGRVPYYSGLRTIDMLGIADTHIAHAAVQTNHTVRTASGYKIDFSTPASIVDHQKYDTEYILSRRPDIVALEITDESVGDSDLAYDLRTEKVFQTLVRFAAGPALPSLIATPEFRRDYVPRLAPAALGVTFVFFERDDALQSLEDAVAEAPDDPKRHFELAMGYRKQGLLLEAAGSMKRVTELDPANFGAALNHAYFLLDARLPMIALHAFRRLAGDFPDRPQAVYGIALCLQKMQRFVEAIPYWTDFLQKDASGRFSAKAREFLAQARAQANAGSR